MLSLLSVYRGKSGPNKDSNSGFSESMEIVVYGKLAHTTRHSVSNPIQDNIFLKFYMTIYCKIKVNC